MKSFHLKLTGFIFIFFLLIISSCKKNVDDSSSVSDQDAEKIAVILNTSNAALYQYQTSLQIGHDSIDAFIDMAKWVIQQEDVSTAFIVDIGQLRIQYKSGLNSYISIFTTDANGKNLWRGGSAQLSSTGKNLLLKNQLQNSTADYIIKNKDVLIFSPFNHEFYSDNYPFMAKFKQGDVKLNPILVEDEKADLAAIDNFKNYGFIIIDAHGLPQGFCIKNKVSELTLPTALVESEHYTADDIEELFIELNDLPIRKFLTGDLVIFVSGNVKQGDNIVYKSTSTLITDKYIRKLPQLNNSIVFGNFCYSGWTFNGPDSNNVSQAFKSIGAASYYGFSFSDGSSTKVYCPFAIAMEDSLISNLVVKGDSTGIAHLQNNITVQQNSIFDHLSPQEIEVKSTLTRGGLMFHPPGPSEPLKFNFFFNPSYKYKDCGTFTDPRDQKVYQLVCIGEQTWFAENLKYNASGSVVYNNNPANEAKFGRLYNYTIVSAGMGIGPATQQGLQGICPNGWHIPSKYDWDKLYAVLSANSSPSEYGRQLKSNLLWDEDPNELNHPLRNFVGFNALPSGVGTFIIGSGIQYFYLNEETNFWASSILQAGNTVPNCVGIVVFSNSTQVGGSGADPTLGPGFSSDFSYRSCRCVADSL